MERKREEKNRKGNRKENVRREYGNKADTDKATKRREEEKKGKE